MSIPSLAYLRDEFITLLQIRDLDYKRLTCDDPGIKYTNTYVAQRQHLSHTTSFDQFFNSTNTKD